MDFSNFGTKDMGIDIGSSKLRVTFEDKGIVLEEPTLIVVNKRQDK
jgi:actin-like ATPase involved in cell morphogenesis